ncbi:MAG: MarR family transcriptional regulator [Alphaproteobacteria bacterium]|nr:MarR family transcriptional regulator [Alphaproteobacteria bacterium]
MRATDTPADLEAHLGYWLRLVSNSVSHGFARKLESHGVTVAEWVVLRMLWDAGAIAPSQLAERIGMTKGAITKLADRLLKKRLIDRVSNADDKRAQTLSLKASGRSIVPRLAALADANEAECFDALSTNERRLLERLLRKVALARDLTGAPTD